MNTHTLKPVLAGLLVVGGFGAATAHAADSGFYIGGSVGGARYQGVGARLPRFVRSGASRGVRVWCHRRRYILHARASRPRAVAADARRRSSYQAARARRDWRTEQGCLADLGGASPAAAELA